MGRLFWKFFAFIWLAQLSAIAAISTVFWFERQQDMARWQAWQATHGQGAPSREPGIGARPPGAEPPPPDERGLRLPPGEPRLDAGPPGPPPDRGPPHGGGGRSGPRHPVPVVPLVATLFASLIFAALLAWYFARPIRTLRRALAAVTAGDLAVRVGGEIGRRDELADLGCEFDRMAAQLQRLMEGQRRLLHDVSHELRSPLARLHAAVGLLRQRPDSLEEIADRIEREGGRMDALVGELLTLSRLDGTGSVNERIEIPLADMLAEIVDDARFEASEREIALATVDVNVPGSPDLLRRAIENILRNALAHTPAGSPIQVRLAAGEGGWAVVQVDDAGPGVPPEELAAIFEPFHRLTQSASTPGNGLGLAIAQRVVTLHGGQIAASNREPTGLRVEIRLPGSGA